MALSVANISTIIYTNAAQSKCDKCESNNFHEISSPIISTSVCNSIPRSAFALRFQNRNQFQNIARRGLAVVHDKIAMLGGNHRAANARAFQAQFVHQFARRNRRRDF